MPLSSANFYVSALSLWAGPRGPRRCKMPASRCRRPECCKLFNQLLMAVVASIFGVFCQQCQRMRDGVAGAQGLLCQQPERLRKRSAHDFSSVSVHCVSRMVSRYSKKMSTLYLSSVCILCEEYTRIFVQVATKNYDPALIFPSHGGVSHKKAKVKITFMFIAIYMYSLETSKGEPGARGLQTVPEISLLYDTRIS